MQRPLLLDIYSFLVAQESQEWLIWVGEKAFFLYIILVLKVL